MIIELITALVIARILATVLAFWAIGAMFDRVGKRLLPIACGLLLSVAMTHLLPEGLLQADIFWAGLLMLVVVLSFVLLELIGTALARRPDEQMQTRPEVRSLLTGMSLHGFADGLVLAGAFVTDSHLGWFAAFAILLHEVPQQAGAAALYRGAGYSRHKTLICLLLPTLFAAIGAATGAVTMLQPFLLPYVLIVSGTSFVYMTMRSFLPHIIAQTKTGRDVVLTLLLLIVGMAAGVALSQQEHEHAHLHAHESAEVSLPLEQ